MFTKPGSFVPSCTKWAILCKFVQLSRICFNTVVGF